MRGNIVVASNKASPKMVCISLARPMMSSPGIWEFDPGPVGGPILWGDEASRECPMAVASAMAPWESTAILDFHPSRVCSGMG